MTQWSVTEPEYLNLCEKPPAGSGEIQEFDNSSPWCKFRYWLIKKIAGKKAIVLNVRIVVIPRIEDRNVIGRMTDTKDGLLLDSSRLWCDNDRMLLLSNNSKA